MPSRTDPPSITTLPYTSTNEAILEVFDRDGVVILSDAATVPTLSKITEELNLSPTTASPTPITALASKSPTLVNELLLSPKLLGLMDARMSKTTKIWHGYDRLTNTSRPQLSATVVFDAAPGTKAEPLHRHDDIYFAEHPLDIAVEIWALWAAGSEGATSSNGAVEAILGSHLWGEDWDPSGHDLAVAEMQPGSCLLLHGSTVHRGGANTSSSLRRTIGVSWTQGHLRQEENQYLNISKEKAMSLDEKTQRFIGYKTNAPMGGWYELRDPITYLQTGQTVKAAQTEFLDEKEE